MCQALDKLCDSYEDPLNLCGANDKANMESARLFHDAMKNSRCIIVEDCGQEVNKDHPYRVASILQGFWNEC